MEPENIPKAHHRLAMLLASVGGELRSWRITKILVLEASSTNVGRCQREQREVGGVRPIAYAPTLRITQRIPPTPP